MEKLSTLFLFGSLLVMYVFGSYVEAHLPNAEGFELQDLHLGKEKITKLRFYLQDLVSGDNQTAYVVARPNITSTSTLPSYIGLVLVIDNLATSGPEIDSEEVGRVQGAVALSDFKEPSLALLLNIVFTKGEYKGSTLSILGRNPLLQKTRELSIVGGTGVFRMARGYIITRTYSTNPVTQNGVYEYNLVVSHYSDPKILSSVNEGMQTCDVKP